MSTEQTSPTDPYERAVELARCESLLEMIQTRELMINCNRYGVLVVDASGREVRGHDLKQVLESMR